MLIKIILHIFNKNKTIISLVTYINPTYIELPEVNDAVKRFLTFTDRSTAYQVSKLKQNYRWKQSDPEGFKNRIDQLKADSVKTLIFTKNGIPCTYSGLVKDLNTRFGWSLNDGSLIKPDEPRMIPWAKEPEHKARYYQIEAVEALIKARHGAVEIPTGGGKSMILLELSKRNPVQQVIVTPSKNITKQLYNEYVERFGKKYVGMYGGGKKDIGKLFTICVAHSLAQMKEGTKEWDYFSKTKQLSIDESHVIPASTFEAFCTGLLKDAYWRYFVSATQIRTDGSEMILKGITGPVVYRKTFKDLVEEGYLARPKFKVIRVGAMPNPNDFDINEETRKQFYLNSNINRITAEIAAKMVNNDKQVLILIDEFRQFDMLKNYMTIPFEFAHGGASQDAKEFLPEQYWKSDVEDLVEKFNNGKIGCLIGTSAISTGVDIRPTKCLINLQGGTSEIKVKQGIGRGTRIVPGKTDFFVVDFLVDGSKSMERHLRERVSVYEELGEVDQF
jgi:superfamily II DNA or RNA helicase